MSTPQLNPSTTTTTTTTSIPPPRISTPQPPIDPSDTRPLILCLHGGGSTSTVFKIQSRRLIWGLSPHFRFIFADAPHPGAPGHGMLPVFASCAPFHRWVTRKWTLGAGEREDTPVKEVKMLDEVLDACVARETGVDVEDVRKGGGKGWDRVVGVMGFSQGARLVGGLLLRQKVAEMELLRQQQQQQRQQRQRDDGGDGDGVEGGGEDESLVLPARTDRNPTPLVLKHQFKFGILVGGPYPPIALSPVPTTTTTTTTAAGREDYSLLRTIPTVHAWGRSDHVKSGCEEMHAACDGDECFQMDFEGGHHMPLQDSEARDLCDLIRAAWYASGGEFAVGAGGKGEKY